MTEREVLEVRVAKEFREVQAARPSALKDNKIPSLKERISLLKGDEGMTLNLVKDRFGYPLPAPPGKSPRQDDKTSPIVKGGVQNKREIFMRQISSPDTHKPFLKVTEGPEEPPPPPPRANIPKPGLFPSNTLGRQGSGPAAPPLVKSSSQDDIMSAAPVHKPTGGVRAMASKFNSKISSSIEALEAAHRSPISPSKMSLTSSSDSLSSTASNITVKSVSPVDEAPPSLPPRPSPTKAQPKSFAPPLASPETSDIPSNLVSNSPFKTGHLSPVKNKPVQGLSSPPTQSTGLSSSSKNISGLSDPPTRNPGLSSPPIPSSILGKSPAKSVQVPPGNPSRPLPNGFPSPPSPKTIPPSSPKPVLPSRTSKPPSPTKPTPSPSRTLPHIPPINTSSMGRTRPAAPTPPASPRPRVSHPPPPPAASRASSSPQVHRRSAGDHHSVPQVPTKALTPSERLSGGRKLPVPPPSSSSSSSSPKSTLQPNGHHNGFNTAASPKLGTRFGSGSPSLNGGGSPKPILKNGRVNGHMTNGHHQLVPHLLNGINGLNGDVYMNNDFDPSDLSLEGTSVDDDADLQRSLVFKKAEEVVVRVVDQLKESRDTCGAREGCASRLNSGVGEI